MEDILQSILIFGAIGFLAQLVDGGLGMGFGIISNTVLISLGVPPSVSSASIHISESFTTGVSSFFHWKLGNVEKRMFWNLMLSGVIGGIGGAYILTHINGDLIKPFVAVYLFFLGTIIVRKAFFKIHQEDIENHFFPIRFIARNVSRFLHIFHPTGTEIASPFARSLGFLGGFLDAIGGGGWGPIVTSTLVFKGHSPRHSIGTANASEFFITFTTSITFLLSLGLFHGWQNVIGLLIGGSISAPISALLCKKIPPRFLMLIVGLLIVLLSCFSLYNSSHYFFPEGLTLPWK